MSDEGTSRTRGKNKACRQSNDIKRSTYEHGPEPWKDPQVLSVLYEERDYSQYDIAERFDISQEVVSYWMDKLDVDADPPMHKRDPSISRVVREDGRVQYKVPDGDGERTTVYESHLAALAELPPHAVFAEDTHVHHEMGSSVKLNLPANLDVLGDAEHVRRHAGGTACLDPEIVLAEIRGFDEDNGDDEDGDEIDADEIDADEDGDELSPGSQSPGFGTASGD